MKSKPLALFIVTGSLAIVAGLLWRGSATAPEARPHVAAAQAPVAALPPLPSEPEEPEPLPPVVLTVPEPPPAPPDQQFDPQSNVRTFVSDMANLLRAGDLLNFYLRTKRPLISSTGRAEDAEEIVLGTTPGTSAYARAQRELHFTKLWKLSLPLSTRRQKEL